MKHLLSIIILLALTGQMMPSAYAQESNSMSLSISPPVIEINATPPASVESIINLENKNEAPVTLSIMYKSFRLSDTRNGQIEFIGENNKIEGPDPLILQKIKIYDGENPVDKIELGPLEGKSLTLRIDLEKDAPVGDYYFSLIFVSEQSLDQEQSQSAAPGGIGTNIILSVGQKGDPKGQILDFSTPLFLSSGPVPFTLLMKNDSQQYVVPTGRISIKNIWGKDVGRVDILPQYILSGSERYMIDTDQAGTPSAEVQDTIAKYAKEHNILLWPESFLFGLYTAEAHIKLTDNGPTFVTSTRFIAVPLYLVFAISFFMFVLLGIYLKVRKKV